MRPADELTRRRDRVLARRQEHAGGAVELASRRTSHGKLARLGRRRWHLSQSAVPVHYQAGGRWEEIDTAFESDPDGTVTMRRAPYVASLLDGVVGWRHTSRAGGWMQMELLAVDGRPVGAAPAPRVVGEQVFWDQVAPGVDLKLVAYPAASEVFKRFAGAGPRELEWRVTHSPDPPVRLQEELHGWDRRGDRLEILTERDGDRFVERWTGRVSRVVDRATRRKAWRRDAEGPVVVDASIQESIGANADDGTEFYHNATWNSDFTPYGIVVDRSDPQTIYFNGGLRFQSLAIPSGATITAATLTLNVDSVYGTPTVRWYGDDVDDAAAWSNSSRPSQITRTTAYADWGVTATGTGQTVDVQGIVAEILGRGGWASGNDVRFGGFQTPTGSSYVVVEDYGAAGSNEAQLDVTFETGPTPSSPHFTTRPNRIWRLHR